jgi:hypothetical protein
MQETAKKCQKTTNRKLGSGYSLKMFPSLGSASVAADVFYANDSRTVIQMRKMLAYYYEAVGFCLANEIIISARGRFCKCV